MGLVVQWYLQKSFFKFHFTVSVLTFRPQRKPTCECPKAVMTFHVSRAFTRPRNAKKMSFSFKIKKAFSLQALRRWSEPFPSQCQKSIAVCRRRKTLKFIRTRSFESFITMMRKKIIKRNWARLKKLISSILKAFFHHLLGSCSTSSRLLLKFIKIKLRIKSFVACLLWMSLVTRWQATLPTRALERALSPSEMLEWAFTTRCSPRLRVEKRR